jgi:hypothetical protein
LLRADIIISEKPLRRKGIILVERQAPDAFVYADARLPILRKRGWANIAQKSAAIQQSERLLFHPFRFYVLYHLQRILELHIVPMQMLVSSRGFARLLKIIISSFTRWSSSANAQGSILAWNDSVALAVLAEPFTYRGIFHSRRTSLGVDFKDQERLIAEHEKEVLQLYRDLPRESIDKSRLELASDAALLDGNRDVHIMLRLAKGKSRLDTRGKLGAATYLLTMAEMVRRATEAAYGIQLPEEDEIGFGMVPPNLKLRIYGSNRLYDGHRAAAREYMRQLGLDYRTRLRWYVEGDTEFGALKTVFGEREGETVQLVNLKGNFGKNSESGLRNSLREDLRDGTFSFVSLDSDRTDHVRVLRLAAQNDEICGLFFLHHPDFEFANFDLNELATILCKVALKMDGLKIDPHALIQTASSAGNAKQLFQIACKAVHLSRTKKDQVWGAALMEYTLENPIQNSSGKKRPIIEAIGNAMRSNAYSYQIMRKEYRVDPQNGQLVERQKRG